MPGIPGRGVCLQLSRSCAYAVCAVKQKTTQTSEIIRGACKLQEPAPLVTVIAAKQTFLRRRKPVKYSLVLVSLYKALIMTQMCKSASKPLYSAALCVLNTIFISLQKSNGQNRISAICPILVLGDTCSL